MRPMVVATSPGDGTTAPAATHLEVEFSEPMNRASVAITLSPPVTLGAPSWRDSDRIVAVIPTAALAFQQQYAVTITGSDLAGNAVAPAHTFSFTTQPMPDVTPPQLTSTLPANGAIGVSTATMLQVTFSEPMSRSSALLTLTPAVSLSAPSWGAGDTQLTFVPSSPLPTSTTFTADVSGTDPAGNPLAGTTRFTFTTAAPPDQTPPVLLATTPVADAGAVPVTTDLVLTFDEPIDTASLQLTVTPPADQGTPTWTDQNRTATFSAPVQRWANLTDYVVGITASDPAANAMAAELRFRTAPDVQPPTLVSTNPADGAIGVMPDAGISLTFSEAMNQASAQSAFSVAGYDAGTFSWAGNVMTWRPPAPFPFGAQIAFDLAPGAVDSAGNAMATGHTATFRVRRRSTGTFYATGTSAFNSTADGYLHSDAACTTVPFTSPGAATAAAGSTGATNNGLGQMWRGFLSFDLGTLAPLANVTIVSATLNAAQVACSGNPFTVTFGQAIQAWHVSYGPTLSAAACATPNLGNRRYLLSNSLTLGARSVEVAAAVQDDWLNRAARGSLTQFMLRTATLAYVGGSPNYCAYGTVNNNNFSNRPRLVVTYEYD